MEPSKSPMWTRCAAQPTLEARSGEQPESDPAREGTCAAWIADCVLRGDAGDAYDLDGRNHKNGWLVTPDMCQHVQGYIDLVRSFGGVTTSEQFVRLCDFIAGTLDLSAALQSGVLHVIDLKYGYRLVEVVNHKPLIIYGAAEIIRLNDPTILTINLSIYQPRAFHADGIYRTWTLTVPELWEHVTKIYNAGLACQQSNPLATPGEHCDYCGAASTCAALAAATYVAFDQVHYDGHARQMSAVELANEWIFLEQASALIKARKSAVDTETEQRMKQGEHIPGLHYEKRYGNRKFKVPMSVVKMLTGIDPHKQVAMTPAELERAGGNVEIVKHLAERPSIGYSVERVTPAKIAKQFES